MDPGRQKLQHPVLHLVTELPSITNQAQFSHIIKILKLYNIQKQCIVFINLVFMMRRENIHTPEEVEPDFLEQKNRLPLRSLAAAMVLTKVLSQDVVSTEPVANEQTLSVSEENQDITPSDYPECSDNLSRLGIPTQSEREVELNYASDLALFSLWGESPGLLLPHGLTMAEQINALNERHHQRGYELHLAQSLHDAMGDNDSLEYGPVDSNEAARRELNFSLAIEHIHHILHEYPDELLKTLDIQSVVISSESEHAGVYYRSAANSVELSDKELEGRAVEISLHTILHKSRFNNYSDVNALRRVVAHEIGHAIHDSYCRPGVYYNDPIFSDGIAFLNDNPRQIDLALADEGAGRNREYVREYSTKNVAEQFATIIDYTLSKRGIIQPGDADYNSPLQRAQERALVRAELVYPGFIKFAEQVSQLINEHGLPVINESLDSIAASEQPLEYSLLSDTHSSRDQ